MKSFHILFISIILASTLILFGCTENTTIPGVPFTASQFIGKVTDLNYTLFQQGYYDGNLVSFDGNKFSVFALDINSYDINWSQLVSFPAGCGANQAVKIVGSSLVCVDLPVDTNWQTSGQFNPDTNTLTLKNGRLGIGTTAPAATLDVNGSSGLLFNVRNGSTSYLDVNATTGNVGIGTTTPQNKLNVVGDINATTQIYDGGLLTGAVVFPTTGGKLTGDTNFFWDNTNKRLGIATTSPASKLDVNGDVMLRGTISVNSGTSGDGTIYGTSYNSLNLKAINLRAMNFLVGPSGSEATKLSINGTTGYLSVGKATSTYQLDVNGQIRNTTTSGTTVLFTSTDGNLGIGTNSPQSKVEVNGTIDTNAIKMPGSSAFPSKDFEIKQYQTRSIGIFQNNASTTTPQMTFFDYGIISFNVPVGFAYPSTMAYTLTSTDWSAHGVTFKAQSLFTRKYFQVDVGAIGTGSQDTINFTPNPYSATATFNPRSSGGNPLVNIFSGISPQTRNTDWLSLQHDQTNAVIEAGTGNIVFNNNVTIIDRNVKGAEKITNGTFTGSATGWDINGAGWAYGTNNVTKNVDGTGTLRQTSANMITPLVVGEWYELSFDISALNSSASSSPAYTDKLTIECAGWKQVITSFTENNESASVRYQFKALNTNDLNFSDTNLLRVVIDNVSLKKITDGDLTMIGDVLLLDGGKTCYGDACDASIKYTGTDLNINPKELGNGSVNINGNVHIDGNVSFKRPYGMFSSTKTQTIVSTSTPYVMDFNNTEDSYQVYRTTDNNFSFGQTGDYLIELSIMGMASAPNKHLEIWVQKNGADVPRSNTRYEFKGAGSEAVIAVMFIIDMNMTDNFRVMYASQDDTGITLPFTAGTSYSPSTPSSIMTISKVSEVNN